VLSKPQSAYISPVVGAEGTKGTWYIQYHLSGKISNKKNKKKNFFPQTR
jgi:hypothetical protein